MIGDLGYVYMIKYFHIVLDYVIMYYGYIGVCVIGMYIVFEYFLV